MPGFELFGNEERKEVNDVLETGVLFRYGFDDRRNGHWKARDFELELSNRLKAKYSHLCSSGTAALVAALSACGIKSGDEVVVPPFTFVATIESLLLGGMIPIFSEIDETLCLCPESLSSVITEKTKAVIVVHMCGSMAKIDKIVKFCESRKLILIEDTCQSLGGTFDGKFLGNFGKAGCFSFDFLKTVTCGEGGAVITNCEKTYSAVSSFTDHGHDHLGSDRGLENHFKIGTNLRISELNAAVGLAQIRKLNQILLIQKRNKKIIKDILSSIENLKFREIPDIEGDSGTFLSFFMPTSSNAEMAMSKLMESNVDGCFYWFTNNWHYIKQWNHLELLNILKKKSFNMSDKLLNYSKVKMSKSDLIMSKTISMQIKIAWDAEELERRADNMKMILKKLV